MSNFISNQILDNINDKVKSKKEKYKRKTNWDDEIFNIIMYSSLSDKRWFGREIIDKLVETHLNDKEHKTDFELWSLGKKVKRSNQQLLLKMMWNNDFITKKNVRQVVKDKTTRERFEKYVSHVENAEQFTVFKPYYNFKFRKSVINLIKTRLKNHSIFSNFMSFMLHNHNLKLRIKDQINEIEETLGTKINPNSIENLASMLDIYIENTSPKKALEIIDEFHEETIKTIIKRNHVFEIRANIADMWFEYFNRYDKIDDDMISSIQNYRRLEIKLFEKLINQYSSNSSERFKNFVYYWLVKPSRNNIMWKNERCLDIMKNKINSIDKDEFYNDEVYFTMATELILRGISVDIKEINLNKFIDNGGGLNHKFSDSYIDGVFKNENIWVILNKIKAKTDVRVFVPTPENMPKIKEYINDICESIISRMEKDCKGNIYHQKGVTLNYYSTLNTLNSIINNLLDNYGYYNEEIVKTFDKMSERLKQIEKQIEKEIESNKDNDIMIPEKEEHITSNPFI